MTRRIDYKKTNLSYNILSTGKTIVLLHGYLESKEVWYSFAEELSKDFQIIIPDIPGHGKSSLPKGGLSVEIVANALKNILDKENIKECVLVGHSMGGYVALAFLELFQEYLTGLCLFHSSPYADNDEKKKNRDREINIIKEGKKAQVYNAHFPNTFAKENVIKFSEEIEKCKKTAENMQDEGIIAAIVAMKKRPDRTEILKSTKVPIQYIIGEKDNFIPMGILKKLRLPDNSEVVVLENSGHMGFIEEKENSLRAIKNFMRKL